MPVHSHIINIAQRAQGHNATPIPSLTCTSSRGSSQNAAHSALAKRACMPTHQACTLGRSSGAPLAAGREKEQTRCTWGAAGAVSGKRSPDNRRWAVTTHTLSVWPLRQVALPAAGPSLRPSLTAAASVSGSWPSSPSPLGEAAAWQ
eukprot:scaffold19506_cov68-Phaeocystis_antarctica.AAC.2